MGGAAQSGRPAPHAFVLLSVLAREPRPRVCPRTRRSRKAARVHREGGHMKRFLTSLLPAAIAVAPVAAAVPSTASAFNLRSPQVPVLGGTLQGYLNSVGESINVNTDQLDAQVWTTSVSGNATFTLMIELAGNAAANNIGVY